MDETLVKLRATRLPENAIIEIGNVLGPAGAIGRRGPDGAASPDTKAIQISQEDVERLARMIEGIAANSARLTQLGSALKDLERRIEFAESDRIEKTQQTSPKSGE